MIFRHVDDCLRFAFSIRERDIVKTAQFAPSVRASDDPLTIHDLHAQGALILSSVNRTLPPMEQLFVYARYSVREEFRHLVCESLAADYIKPRVDCSHQLCVDLTERYFAPGNRRKSQRHLAHDNHIHQSTVQKWESRVSKLLNGCWIRAEAMLCEPFEASGLVVYE